MPLRLRDLPWPLSLVPGSAARKGLMPRSCPEEKHPLSPTGERAGSKAGDIQFGGSEAEPIAQSYGQQQITSVRLQMH